MSKEEFLTTLETLGIKDVDTSEIDNFISEPGLKGFLEYFCTLNEENILTDEEAAEFESIPPSELDRLQKIIDNEEETIADSEEDEAEIEENYLKEQLSQMENRTDALKVQKESLLQQVALLSEEKVECERRNTELRSISAVCEAKLPNVKKKLNETLSAIQELVTGLEFIITSSNDTGDVLPNLKQKDIDEYRDSEENIVKSVSSYLQSNFQFVDETKSTLFIPGPSEETINKEISVISESLKKSKIAEYNSMIDYKKKLATIDFIKHKDSDYDNLSAASSSQLDLKLKEERAYNEKLIKRESLLKSYVSNAVNGHVEAQCKQIALARSLEVLEYYKQNLEKASFPLQHALNQKARLEILILYLKLYHKNLQLIEQSTEEFSSFIKSEGQACIERKAQFEELFKEKDAETPFLPEDSLFLSAYKILNNDADQDLPPLLITDVIEQIKLLLQEREHIKDEKEKNNEAIRSLEKEYYNLKKNALKEKEFSKCLSLERCFSIQANRLNVLIEELMEMCKEQEKSYEEKSQHLKVKSNLRRSRKLFSYALLDPEIFHAYIEKVKQAMDSEQK